MTKASAQNKNKQTLALVFREKTVVKCAGASLSSIHNVNMHVNN